MHHFTAMSIIPKTFLVVFGLVAFGATSTAQDDSTSVVDLLEKIRLLEDRVRELEVDQTLADNDVLETRINALTESFAAQGTAGDFNTYWKTGLRFDNEDKSFRLRIGGRIQVDSIWGTQDDDFEDKLGHFEDGVRFRRSRIYIQGQIHEHVVFKAQYDFAGGDADFRDVYIGLRKVPGIQNARVGHFKQPYGLEDLTSSKYITFLERSLHSTLGVGRETGVMVNGTLTEEDLITYAVSIYRDVDDFGDSSPPEDGKYNFAFRLSGLPIYDDDGRTLLHLGFAVQVRNPNQDMLRFRSRPETSIGPRIVDTGSFVADNAYVLNLEVALVLDSFSAQGEFAYVLTDGTESSEDPEFFAFYFQLSYFITGEHRPYKKSAGAFDRVQPNSIFMEDGSGAIELVARVSFLDLNDENINGGEIFDLTFGATWYLNPNTQIKLNYVFGDGDALNGGSEGQVHIVAIRFQIDF